MQLQKRFQLVNSRSFQISFGGALLLLMGYFEWQAESNSVSPWVARITAGPAPHTLVIFTYLATIFILGLVERNFLRAFILTWGVVGVYELMILFYWNLYEYPVYDIGVQQVVIYTSYFVCIGLSVRWWGASRLAYLGLLGAMYLVNLGGIAPLFGITGYHSTLYPGGSPTSSPYFLNVMDNFVEVVNVAFACFIFTMIYLGERKRYLSKGLHSD